MYDLVIIGGGPGGLTAGIYAVRAKLNTVMLEKEMVGGQIALSDEIENYPGFPSISGMDLMQKFEEHAKKFDLEIKMAGVESITLDGKVKVLKTSEGEIRAKAVIISTGAKPKKLGVPGETEFLGKGVSYCATCDGPFFRGQDVLVVGGGDTAVKEAVYLAKIANKVSVVHRRDKLRAEKILQERLLKAENITVHWDSVLREIKGESGVESAVIENVKTSEKTELKVHGAFMFVGINPTTDLTDAKKNDSGFIITNEKMETSIPGVYAVGDCRNTPLLQVATAVGDGAIAAYIAESYVEGFDD